MKALLTSSSGRRDQGGCRDRKEISTAPSYAANGPLTWTLRATQEGAAAAVKLASGTVAVTGGTAVAHDFAGAPATPDGTGDLLTLNSSGALTFQLGKASTGAFSGKVGGSGRPTTARFVSYGDLSGDRCNDLLVRLSSGALRLYRPGCGKAVTPSTPYTSLGTSGWNQYDVLTSPGDISGDGRADLVCRDTGGTLWRDNGNGKGSFGARAKVSTGWQGYKSLS